MTERTLYKVSILSLEEVNGIDVEAEEEVFMGRLTEKQRDKINDKLVQCGLVVEECFKE